MYIYVYTITREKVTTMTNVFFLFVCSDYPSRVCSWSTCSIEYSSPPVLPNRKKARQNFISLFLVFLSQTKIKNEGQEKSAFIQSCAREE